MRRAALWLFLIMIASYSIAFSAMKGMNIKWDNVDGLVVNDGIVLLAEGERMNLNETKTASLENVEKIEVKGISSDIRVVPEDRDDVYAELKGYYEASGNYTPPKLVVEKNGGTLEVKVEHAKQNWVNSRLNLDLLVILPESYVKDLKVEGVSSEVVVEFGNYSELKVSTVSGDVRVDSVKTDSLHAASTSGEVELQDAEGKVNAETVSGDIDVQYGRISGNSSLRSTSGEIRITVPQGEAFAVDFKTTSGEIDATRELRFDKMNEKKLSGSTGDFDHTIGASTISGDIQLR